MQTDETRALVERFLTARAANDREALAALLDDDAEWQPPVSAGFGPIKGRDKVAAALAGGATGKLFDVDTVRRTVHKLVVEGDTAVALQRMTATTRKGAAYDNEYCWVYSCRDGKVVRLDEYADTLNAARIFGTVS
jgi:uncharacterized protein (TIGR02246 family)